MACLSHAALKASLTYAAPVFREVVVHDCPVGGSAGPYGVQAPAVLFRRVFFANDVVEANRAFCVPSEHLHSIYIDTIQETVTRAASTK